ncbi:MAG: hypothetical protein ACE14P_01980 [Methanotrichaceae archaeon]
MPDNDRERFEQDYKDWLLLMARDATHRLAAMPPARRSALIDGYNRMKNPHLIFRRPLDMSRIERLAGIRIASFIVVETDAITFFPSIYSSGALDFAVAMNRRFFYNGLWFPIIALNSEYIRRSSDKVLAFTLDHEFEMSRIYMEISMNMRSLSPDEKRGVVDSAQIISTERLKITQDELIEDEKLMQDLSGSEPLIPKPYAESALLIYLEDNYNSIKQYGQKSGSPDEDSFGEGLLREFQGWSEFSQKTYVLFVSEILSNLRDANKGYA